MLPDFLAARKHLTYSRQLGCSCQTCFAIENTSAETVLHRPFQIMLDDVGGGSANVQPFEGVLQPLQGGEGSVQVQPRTPL